MSEYIYERPDQPAKVVRDGWNVKIEWGFVQREEIIRCMDCKHYTDDEMEYCHYCNKWCEQVELDGFCAWGERRGRESAEVWNQWSADDVTCSEES